MIDSDDCLSSALDQAPISAACLSADGRFAATTTELQRLLGRSRDELVGSDIEDFRHPDELPFVEAGAFRQRPAGDRWVAERRLKTGGQSFVWTHIAVTPRVGTACFIAIIQDISAQRQAQADLAMLFDVSPDMLAVAKAGHLVRVNRAFTAVLGHAPEVLLSAPIIEFVHPDDRAATLTQMERVSSDTANPGFTNRWRTKGGEYKWLEWHARQDPATGLRHAVARDISEHHHLRQQMQQMQKIEAVGQLAGGVAHDFNNMLTAILGFAELAEYLIPEGAPGRAEVGEVIKAAGRAAALTQQLLAFSRQQLLRPEPLDVHAIVQDMGAMLRRLIGEHVQLHLTAETELWVVEADKVQLEQVMLNLVVNARDAMPHGGHVMLETRNVQLDEGYCAAHPAITPGEYVLVSITDTGTGMSEDVKARLFEPFFTTKAGTGTGMGLATVYGIVKQSGGFIWVYSEPGWGSTFKVYLPRSGRMLPEPQLPVVQAGALTGSEIVLVVDDQRDILHVIASVLKRSGYTVLTARDRDEALGVLEQVDSAVDLLLVDVVMPDVSGTKIAAEAVALRPNLRVLYMSGYTSNAAVRNGVLEAGMALLEKPFSAAALLRRVREALATQA